MAVEEPLFEVATDKVNTEIPSLYAGVISDILVAEGTTVPVGTELARIGGNSGSRSHLHSPVVRRLAREHRIDLSAVHGTGAGGRITRDDLLALVKNAVPGPQPQQQPPTTGAGVPFSPL